MSKPYYHQDGPSPVKASDTVEWTGGQEEDAWFIKKKPSVSCCCGFGSPGDWSAGKHHGVHRCAEVITSITGNKRVSI
jgi:hypothetical protein